MKRAIVLLLSLLSLLLILTSCDFRSKREQAESDLKAMIAEALPDIPPEKIADLILRGLSMDKAALERLDLTATEEEVNFYMTEIYGLEKGAWTDLAIYRAGGAEAFEIAVIRFGDAKAAEKASETLTNYIRTREGAFTGYEPEQAEIVHQSLAAFSEYGDAALLICENPEMARSYFQSSYRYYFRYPFTPPGIDDMTCYDTTAILTAWESGDTSRLSKKDAEILELAGAVLAERTHETMSDYEKEHAIYNWLTATVRYDNDHYDALKKLSPDSSTPYGPLHNGKGICLGFATTFQLLMDMSGVECITVIGAAYASTEDHAWNMVRLNGEWYCTDATWDEGRMSDQQRNYFNVTSEQMTASDHQWDYENVPEAAARDHGNPDAA